MNLFNSYEDIISEGGYKMDESQLMEQLIRENGDKLWNFCLRLTNNRLIAEDLYQDTMLKAVKLKDNIKWNQNPTAFLFSLAVSINKNRFRRLFRRAKLAPIIDIDINKVIIKDKENIESKIEQSELQKDINIAINNISLNQRAVILMFYMEDMSIVEISKSLNIPVGTVKSRLSIGRSKIKKELEDKGYG